MTTFATLHSTRPRRRERNRCWFNGTEQISEARSQAVDKFAQLLHRSLGIELAVSIPISWASEDGVLDPPAAHSNAMGDDGVHRVGTRECRDDRDASAE